MADDNEAPKRCVRDTDILMRSIYHTVGPVLAAGGYAAHVGVIEPVSFGIATGVAAGVGFFVGAGKREYSFQQCKNTEKKLSKFKRV